jgi:transposase
VQKRKRLAWARKYSLWTPSQWKYVLWTDEANFRLKTTPRSFVWRREGSELVEDAIATSVKWGDGSIMVWGMISGSVKRRLLRVHAGSITATSYQTLIQRVIATLPSLRTTRGRSLVWMQDNAPPHAATSTASYLAATGYQMMTWPPQSPDCNPLEHVWSQIKLKLRGRQFASQDALWAAVQQLFEAVDIQPLLESMPRRVAAVIANAGGHTKY